MITRREQEMLDLQEEGLTPAETAARMGINPVTVRASLARLSAGNDGRADRAAIAASSAALLAAIRRHHPEMVR